MDISKIQICGVGGLGSNLAYLLSRNEDVKELVLIDFDDVEPKNLARQFYTGDDISKPKVVALEALLKKFNPELRVTAYNLKIDRLSLPVLDENALTILATDDLESKKLIATRCRNIFIVNCDRDEFEVKPALDSADRNAWSLRSGYNSNQNFFSNMMAAMEVYRQIYLRIQEIVIYPTPVKKKPSGIASSGITMTIENMRGVREVLGVPGDHPDTRER